VRGAVTSISLDNTWRELQEEEIGLNMLAVSERSMLERGVRPKRRLGASTRGALVT
jgi:hypothetical protein